MNPELISALGEYSIELLGAENFRTLCTLFQQQCAADIISTKPHELKLREQIYAANLGFGQFIDLLQKFAEAHDALENQQPHDTTDDPDVHNIYDVDVAPRVEDDEELN